MVVAMAFERAPGEHLSGQRPALQDALFEYIGAAPWDACMP
jgi:hypothetical protein